MKRLLIFGIIILGTLNLSGQLNPMDKLFKDKPRDIALYLNMIGQYTQIDLKRTVIPGIGAGVIINKKISVGIRYYRSTTNIPLSVDPAMGRLQMKWGGLHLEYTLWPKEKVHLTFPLSVGIGEFKINGNTNGVALTGNPNFIFAEPGFMIEANIWDYAKVGIGASYRSLANVTYGSLKASDISGFNALLSLKFGNFRYSRYKKTTFN